MNSPNEEPRPGWRSGKRGRGQADKRDTGFYTSAGRDWQEDREIETAAVLDPPPACRNAKGVHRLLELLDSLAWAANGRDGGNR